MKGISDRLFDGFNPVKGFWAIKDTIAIFIETLKRFLALVLRLLVSV